MSIVRLTKIFKLEMAHALSGYDGLCKNIHGHSYKLYVTVIGRSINDDQNPKHGMVIDFGDMKKIVNENIVQEFDHALVLSRNTPDEIIKGLKMINQRLLLVPFQPTCENILLDFVKRIVNKFPDNIVLHAVKLYETDYSFCEWYIEDNQ